jgi:hypothetical protein
MEESIKHIEEAIVECAKEFNNARMNKENCVIYKDKLMEEIAVDIFKLRAMLDFENRFHDLIEGDINELNFGDEPRPYKIELLLYAATFGQIKLKLTAMDEAILEALYKAAKAVYEYGMAYCNLSPNSTSFIEDNFGDDARLITRHVYISPSMSDFIRGVQESWHWHGH